MTKSQLQSAQFILLGGMPGAVLLLGGMVWLRRRR
jgi:LPXTG-motif cell wall-anchored protein